MRNEDIDDIALPQYMQPKNSMEVSREEVNYDIKEMAAVLERT